jgi:Ni,Fe-hydrogenase maturation factor
VSIAFKRGPEPLDKPLTGEGMFIIDQFETTLEDGTLHMIDEESVSNTSSSTFRHRGDR